MQPDGVNLSKIILSNRSNSLKYQSVTTSGCNDIEIRKFEFVTLTHISN